MDKTAAAIKAAIMGVLFAVPLGAMLFVPLWFVLAFLGRLVTGQIPRATFMLAGVVAAGFAVWVFWLALGYFRRGFLRITDRHSRGS